MLGNMHEKHEKRSNILTERRDEETHLLFHRLSSFCLFVLSFVFFFRPSVHSSVRPFVRLCFVLSTTFSFARLFVRSLNRFFFSYVLSFVGLFAFSIERLFVRSFVRSLTSRQVLFYLR